MAKDQGLTEEEELELLWLLQEEDYDRSRDSLLEFTRETMPKHVDGSTRFNTGKFHETYYKILQMFAEGKIKNLMVSCPPQHGKLISNDCPVMTTKGWKKHGELVAGDYVYGIDGKPKEVYWESGESFCTHDICFSDGSVFSTHENHTWLIENLRGVQSKLSIEELLGEKLNYLSIIPKYYLPKTNRTNKRIYVKSITPHTQGKKGKCIQVEGGVYLIGKNLIPTHNSEGSTRRLPAYIFGKDPDRKIAITSFNTPFARKFNREVQRIIDSPEYAVLFPNAKINGRNVVTTKSFLRNADEFEVVDKLGSLKAVGRSGALTGSRVDTLIIDDIYKDDAEANSPIIRQKVTDWYDTVADSRLHNDSQQLIVFTRWHEEDLIGYLEKHDNVVTLKSFSDIDPDFDGWYKINFEAIKESDPTEIDPREKGEALWPWRHNIAKLLKSKNRNPEKFNCLYQGNPESSAGLLYRKGFNLYEIPDEDGEVYNSKNMSFPEDDQIRIKLNYTDTADTGKDNLCSINYAEGKDGYLYVTDVLYTPEAMEKTEKWTAEFLDRGQINVSNIESNNGGRGFARNVKAKRRGKTVIKWFTQSGNKESRIFSNSALVQERIIFPSDWHVRWPEFFKAVTKYKRLFAANEFDDAPDTLSGMVEFLTEGKIKDTKNLNSW